MPSVTLALMMSPPRSPEPSEEHHIGSLLLAVASLSHQGYVKIRRGAAGVWRVHVYSPRASPGASDRHPPLFSTGETLRQALVTAFECLRLEQARWRARERGGEDKA